MQHAVNSPDDYTAAANNWNGTSLEDASLLGMTLKSKLFDRGRFLALELCKAERVDVGVSRLEHSFNGKQSLLYM